MDKIQKAVHLWDQTRFAAMTGNQRRIQSPILQKTRQKTKPDCEKGSNRPLLLTRRFEKIFRYYTIGYD
jgi:hypothetical protein